MKGLKLLSLVCVVVLALGVLLSLFSPLARAEWEQLSETGSWEICERDHWKENLESTVGFAEWGNKSVSAFTGYYGTVSFSELSTGATGWGFWENYALTQVSVWLNFTGNCTDHTQIILNLDFKKYLDLWGAIQGFSVQSRVCEDWGGYYGTDAGTLGYQTDVLSLSGYTEVFAYKDGTNFTVAVYNYQNVGENPRLMSVASFAVGAEWFSEVSVNVAVRHQGFHPFNFDGCLSYENLAYTAGTLPTEKGWGENILDTFVNGLINLFSAVPQWLKDVAFEAYSYVKWLSPILNIVLATLVSVLPLLPLILVFYGLDVLTTAVVTGSFEPVGAMFTSLYGLAAGLISALVGVLETIWSFIKFW
jgi:hypothetical protein